MNHTRKSYQHGSLTIEKRKKGPSVWVYRWRERSERSSVKRKQILGTTKELTKTQAQRKADLYKQTANDPIAVASSLLLTVTQLVNHYTERELSESNGKSVKVRKAYRYIFTNYVLPKWGSHSLAAVKAVEVEDWLKVFDESQRYEGQNPRSFRSSLPSRYAS
jgi:hypothetical protein